MTLQQWFENAWFDNPSVDNRWKAAHIGVLLFCIAFCVCTYFLRNKSKKLRVWIIGVIAIALYHFELIRRILRLGRLAVPLTELLTNNDFWYHLLPRPWCAISVWLIMISVLVNKKFFYNIASMNAIICVIIFFAYPSAGFNNQYYTFDNLYSIITHALLFMGGVSMITMGLTEFKYTRTRWYNSALRELFAIVCVFIYAAIEVFGLRIAEDPLYGVPSGFVAPGATEAYENEVQEILGVSGPVYVILYFVFLAFYFNLFYVIQMLVDKARAKKAAAIVETEIPETVA